MTSTYTTSKRIEQPANGDYVGTWNLPLNADMSTIDTAFGGYTVLNPTGLSGNVPLTSSTSGSPPYTVTAQWQPPNLVIGTSLTGTATLTANIVYQLPSGVGGVWTIYNNTTGSYTITFASLGGGTSVVLTQGVRTIVVCDGTNVSVATAPSVSTSSPQTWTAVQTFTNSDLALLGSSTGYTTFTSANTGATNYTATLPANTGTIAELNLAQTWTAAQTFNTGTTTIATASVTGTATMGDAVFSSRPSDTNTLAVGYRGIPQNSQTANYTLALTDNGGQIYLSGSTASQTVTIPANSSIAFPIGATISIINDSTVSWSLAISSDTLVLAGTGNTGTRTLARYALATIVKVTATEWYISGAGVS